MANTTELQIQKNIGVVKKNVIKYKLLLCDRVFIYHDSDAYLRILL